MYNPPTSDSKDVSMVDVTSLAIENQTSQAAELSADANAELTTTSQSGQPTRRKSTIILTDDIDLERMNIDKAKRNEIDDNMQIAHSSTQLAQQPLDKVQQPLQQETPQQSQPQSQSQPQQQPQAGLSDPSLPDPSLTVPVDIKWVQGGDKVYVTGSFTGWRKMIGLSKQPDNNFLITLGLPVGTHRFRFVIDNELRFSDFLPTATDQMGNFVNYVEVTSEHVRNHYQADSSQVQDQSQPQSKEQPPQPSISRRASVGRTATRSDSMWGLTNDDDDMGNGYSRYHDGEEDSNPTNYQYINDIPPIFTDPKVMEQYYVAIDKQSKSSNGQQQAWLHPPQLPPHLENVILNNFNSMDKDNNLGALPIPNHVVLNHLATTSIKHSTLAVASVVRYKRKYVTQVLYAPLQQ